MEEVEAIESSFLLIGFRYDARSNVNVKRRDVSEKKRRRVDPNAHVVFATINLVEREAKIRFNRRNAFRMLRFNIYVSVYIVKNVRLPSHGKSNDCQCSRDLCLGFQWHRVKTTRASTVFAIATHAQRTLIVDKHAKVDKTHCEHLLAIANV